MKRREFLGGMAAFGATPLLAVPARGRIARIGLMTDTHVGMTLESCSRVKAALELFKAKGAEMVINCGDIADRHYPAGYRFYRQTVNTVYPEAAARPKEIFVYADHDLIDHDRHIGRKDPVAAFENVRRLLEIPHPPACGRSTRRPSSASVQRIRANLCSCATICRLPAPPSTAGIGAASNAAGY